jgi:flavin-dependent dehydrogenase
VRSELAASPNQLFAGDSAGSEGPIYLGGYHSQIEAAMIIAHIVSDIPKTRR